jgi:hypothetical protein
MSREYTISFPPLPKGEGRLCKLHQLFGDKLNVMIEELNEILAA